MQGENTSRIKHYYFNPETEALSSHSDALQWKTELVLIRLPDYRQGKCEDFFRASFLLQMKCHQDGLERHILQRIKALQVLINRLTSEMYNFFNFLCIKHLSYFISINDWIVLLPLTQMYLCGLSSPCSTFSDFSTLDCNLS